MIIGITGKIGRKNRMFKPHLCWTVIIFTKVNSSVIIASKINQNVNSISTTTPKIITLNDDITAYLLFDRHPTAIVK